MPASWGQQISVLESGLSQKNFDSFPTDCISRVSGLFRQCDFHTKDIPWSVFLNQGILPCNPSLSFKSILVLKLSNRIRNCGRH